MQGSSYAPLQFLRSPWNRDVYTAIDNQVDGRTTLVLYLGAASSLPSELQKYNVGCILIHKDEKQIYLNTGNDTTPTWQSFGPGTNTLPTPFVTGQYLSNDGVDTFWTLIDLATGVTGLLDSDNIDLSDLANNSDFIDFLVANTYFTTSLANDTNFISQLTSNIIFQNAVSSFVSGSGQTQIDQTPDSGTYGLLSGAVDGINDTFTTSLSTYASGTLQVFLNGMIQEQGAAKDWVELVPNAGTFKFNTPPTVSSVITVVYNKTVTVLNEYKVGATITDTTPKYLDSKFEVISSDGSVTVTKTIQNPAGDEKISYDLSTPNTASTSISTISLFDDFLVQTKRIVVADNVGSPFPIATDAFGSIGQLGWSGFSNTSGGMISTFIGNETNHPGVIQVGGGSTPAWISLGFYDSSGGGTTYNAIDDIMRDGSEYIGIVRATVGVSRFIISGSGNNVPYQASPDNSIWIEFNGTNAVFNTRDGSTTQSTTVITGYSTSTYYNIKFVVNGSSVECYVNGVLQATHSTNVPASGTDGNPAFTTVSGVNPAMRIDYFGIYIPTITR